MRQRRRRKHLKLIHLIIILFLILAIAVLCYKLFASSMSSENYGKVATIENQELTETGLKRASDYKWNNNNTGYELTTMNDCFSDMAYPYPKGWKVYSDSANSYQIASAKNASCIYVEHTQINWNDEFENSTSAEAFKGLFAEKLKNQKISNGNDVIGVRYPDQDYEIAKSKTTKNSGDKFCICYDYPDLTLEQSTGDTTDSGLFERRYYIRSGNNATVMSFICDEKDRKKITTLAEYIISNIKPSTETYSKGYIVQDINNKSRVILPTVFKQVDTLKQIDGEPKLFKIPSSSHSAVAGMFVAVGKTKLDEISEDALSYVFDDAYKSEQSYMENKYVPYSDSSDFPIRKAINKLPFKVLSSSAEQIIIQKTSTDGDKLIETGDTWNVEQFVLNEFGNKNTYIAIGYPSLKQSQATKMVNIILNLGR